MLEKKEMLMEACRRTDLVSGPGFDIPALYRLLCFMNRLEQQKIDLRGKKILDAACGYGAFSLYMGLAYPTSSIISVDSDSGALNYVNETAQNKKIRNIITMRLDLEELSAQEEFDFIIASDILEHVKNDLGLMKRLIYALKKSGYLYINVPYGDPQIKIESLAEEEQKIMSRYGHVRQGYAPDSLKKLLNNISVSSFRAFTEGSQVIDFLHYLWGYFYENRINISDYMFHVILELLEFNFKELKTTGKKSNTVALIER